MSKPTFTRLSMDELDSLSKKKPPASVLLVYLALASHDFTDDGIVFPCIARIAEYINRPTRTVFWALSWLRENGFLIQSSPGSKERFSLVLRNGEIEKVQPLAQIRATPCTDSSNPLHTVELVQPLAQSEIEECNPLQLDVQPLAIDRATPCTNSSNPLHHKKQRRNNEDAINLITPDEFIESPKSEPIDSIKTEKDWIPEKPKQNGSPKCPIGIPQDVFDWVRVCSPLVTDFKICNLTPLRKNPDIVKMLEDYPPPKNGNPIHLSRLIKSKDTELILMRLMI